MIQIKHLLIVLLFPFIFVGCISVEEADYKVISEEGSFELRHYTPHILAETSVDASMEEAGNKAFRRLFNYISGDNSKRKDIAMTAPVSQEALTAEKIAMTAPVGQQKGKDGWLVSFMMPMSYTMETLPVPDNPEVVLRQVPEQKIAAVRYSGSWSEESYLKNLDKLKNWLESKNLLSIGNPVWARYDPPFKPWFLRRNEILLPVRFKEQN